jgi:hypothetical protein
MSRSLPVLIRITGTHTNVGTSEETTLQLGDSSETWLLQAFHYVRSGGSASNHEFRIGQAASFSNGDINERIAYASTAVGTAINDVYTTPIPIRSDSNGRVYLRPGFDAGADNDGDYELYFQLVRG